jgi:hypothetical protein
LERPAAGRGFDINAQARRIIGENAARELRSGRVGESADHSE